MITDNLRILHHHREMFPQKLLLNNLEHLCSFISTNRLLPRFYFEIGMNRLATVERSFHLNMTFEQES